MVQATKRRGRGRPRLGQEKSTYTAVRLTDEMVALIDGECERRRATGENFSRSDAIRVAIVNTYARRR